jgi:hypothetical protein
VQAPSAVAAFRVLLQIPHEYVGGDVGKGRRKPEDTEHSKDRCARDDRRRRGTARGRRPGAAAVLDQVANFVGASRHAAAADPATGVAFVGSRRPPETAFSPGGERRTGEWKVPQERVKPTFDQSMGAGSGILLCSVLSAAGSRWGPRLSQGVPGALRA